MKSHSPNNRPERFLLLASGLLFLTGMANAETLIWSEEFDSGSAPAPATWSYDIGDGCAVGICG